MIKQVALITGVGDGTGAALARRFAEGGYRVAMLARNQGRLTTLETEITGAKGYVCDVGDLDALIATVNRVGSEMGNPSVLVHNAVSATFKTFLEADPRELEKNFRVNTTSLLYLARALAPNMIEQGAGAIMVTGNTAALRGPTRYRRVRTDQSGAAHSRPIAGARTGAKGRARGLRRDRHRHRHALDAGAVPFRQAGRLFQQTRCHRRRSIPRCPPGPLNLDIRPRCQAVCREMVTSTLGPGNVRKQTIQRMAMEPRRG